MDRYEWFVGIDWATSAHQACILDAAGTEHGQKSFNHSGSGLSAMADRLEEISAAEPASIAVAIEVPHGAVVEGMLLEGFAVFSINPKQSDRLRDRLFPAGVKDDRRDARVLANALRTDQSSFRRVDLPNPLAIELRDLTHVVDDLTRQRTQQSNRIRRQLDRYYPQFTQLCNVVTHPWLLELWTMAPTPAKARTLSKARVARLLKRHRIRRIHAGGVLEILGQPPLKVVPGTTEGAQRRIAVAVDQIQLIGRQLADAQTQLDETIEAFTRSDAESGRRDVAILKSLPGVGRMVLATLLAESHELLRRRDYHGLRCLSGAAPVTRRSGKGIKVERRRAYHHRLGTAMWHWARVAIQNDPVSRRKYDALRARGHSHARSLRTVGDRLLAVACAMLESQTNYQADRRSESAQLA